MIGPLGVQLFSRKNNIDSDGMCLALYTNRVFFAPRDGVPFTPSSPCSMFKIENERCQRAPAVVRRVVSLILIAATSAQ